eukprot:1694626-Lingulodinium_polyedra.AAC.1
MPTLTAVPPVQLSCCNAHADDWSIARHVQLSCYCNALDCTAHAAYCFHLCNSAAAMPTLTNGLLQTTRSLAVSANSWNY